MSAITGSVASNPSLLPDTPSPGVHPANPSIDASKSQGSNQKTSLATQVWQKCSFLWRSFDKVAGKAIAATNAIIKHTRKQPATEKTDNSNTSVLQLQSHELFRRFDEYLAQLEAAHTAMQKKQKTMATDAYNAEIIHDADLDTVLSLHQSQYNSAEAFLAQQTEQMASMDLRIKNDILQLNSKNSPYHDANDNADDTVRADITARIQTIQTAQNINQKQLKHLTELSSNFKKVIHGRQVNQFNDQKTRSQIISYFKGVMRYIDFNVNELLFQHHNKSLQDLCNYNDTLPAELDRTPAQKEHLHNLTLKTMEAHHNLQAYLRKSQHCIERIDRELQAERNFVKLTGHTSEPEIAKHLTEFEQSKDQANRNIDTAYKRIKQTAQDKNQYALDRMKYLELKTTMQLQRLRDTSQILSGPASETPGKLLPDGRSKECIDELEALQLELVTQSKILRPITDSQTSPKERESWSEAQRDTENLFDNLWTQIQTDIKYYTDAQEVRGKELAQLFGTKHGKIKDKITAFDERLYVLSQKIASVESDLASHDPEVLLNPKCISEFQTLLDEAIQLQRELYSLYQPYVESATTHSLLGKLTNPDPAAVRDFVQQRLTASGRLCNLLHKNLFPALKTFAETQVAERTLILEDISQKVVDFQSMADHNLAENNRNSATQKAIVNWLNHCFESMKYLQSLLSKQLEYYTSLELPAIIKKCTSLEATRADGIRQVIALQGDIEKLWSSFSQFELTREFSQEKVKFLQAASQENEKLESKYQTLQKQLNQLQAMPSSQSEKYSSLNDLKIRIRILSEKKTSTLTQLEQQKNNTDHSTSLGEQIAKHEKKLGELITSLNTLQKNCDELLLASSREQIKATKKELADITKRWDNCITTIELVDTAYGEIPLDDTINTMEGVVREIQSTNASHRNQQEQLLTVDFPEIRKLIQAQRKNIACIKDRIQKQQGTSQVTDTPNTSDTSVRQAQSISSGNEADLMAPSQEIMPTSSETQSMPEQVASKEMPEQATTLGQENTASSQHKSMTDMHAKPPVSMHWTMKPESDKEVQEDRAALVNISKDDNNAKNTAIRIAKKANGDDNQAAETRAILASNSIAVKYLTREIVRNPGITGAISYVFRSMVAKIGLAYLGTTALTKLYDLYAPDTQKSGTPEVLTEKARLKVLANLLENKATPESFKKKMIYDNHGTAAWEYLTNIENYANVPDCLKNGTLKIKNNKKTIELIEKLVSNMGIIRKKTAVDKAQAIDIEVILLRSIAKAKSNNSNPESLFSTALTGFEDQLKRQSHFSNQS